MRWSLALVGLSVVLDLGQLHALQTSDSLVPSLVSLQAWTPFFWQQDRYGMLVPLIFGGITHPLYNQLAITWASVLGGLCAVMAVAHLFFGRQRVWPLIGLGAIGMLVGSAPQLMVFDMLGPGQFFSTPMAIGVGAVWLLEHDTRARARCLALCLLALAAWINYVSPVWLALLYGAQQTAQPGQALFGRRFVRALKDKLWVYVSFAAAFGVGLCASKFGAVQDVALTEMGGPAALARACMRLTQAWVRLMATSAALLGSIVLLVLAAVLAAYRRTAPGFGRGAAQACAACAVYMLLVASERWVAQSAYHYRFWLPAALVLMVAWVGAGAGPWLQQTSLQTQRYLAAALWCAVLGATLVRFGAPCVAGVRQSYQDLAGAWLEETHALQCTHLAGGYWRVWPVVFAANIERYEAGTSAQLFGVTDRTEATVHLWPNDPQSWRICLPPGDRVALGYLRGIAQQRFVPAGRGAHLSVVRPATDSAGPILPHFEHQ